MTFDTPASVSHLVDLPTDGAFSSVTVATELLSPIHVASPYIQIIPPQSTRHSIRICK